MKILRYLFLLVFLQGASAFAQDDYTFVPDTLFFPVKYNNAWYFMDTSGTVHEEKPHYSSVYPVYFFASVYYIVGENGKYGALDQYLEVFQELKYDTIIASSDYFLLQDGKNWTHHSYEGNIQIEADSVFQQGDNVYYFNKGKTGLVSNNILITIPKYERIAGMHTFSGFFLAYDAGKFGLMSREGKLLLPAEYAEIQEFDYGFVKCRKHESWKYFHVKSGITVDPQGKDILFYSDRCWKIYNSDRSRSTLYLDGGQKSLSGSYDDYFLFSNQQIAVRKNGKVGLLNEHGTLLISPKYEQIEQVDDQFYQYKQKELWGFMNANGQEILPAAYNHFLPVRQYANELYFVLKNGSCGLMDRTGKLILPIAYDYIFFLKDVYVLQSGGKFGIANLDGKILAPCEYPAFDIVKQYNQANFLVIFQRNKEFTAFSKYGKLNASPCQDFVYGNDVLKCYGEDYVEVYVLSPDGKMEDYHRYDGIQSFMFNNSSSNWYREPAGKFDRSYLEENQQNGLFGVRLLQEAGMAVDSRFKYVRQTQYLEIYTAHEAIDKLVFDKLGHAQLETSEGAYLLWTKTGTIQSDLIVNTEAFDIAYKGTATTNSDMKMNRDFSIRWITNYSSPFEESKLIREAIYTDQVEDYKRVYFGGKADLVPLAESDIPAIQYFNYMNQLRNFWFTDAASAQTYMDPQLGVRFSGGEWKVLRVTEYADMKPAIEFKSGQSFEAFSQIFFADQYLVEEKGSGNLQFIDVWNDTTRLEQLEGITHVESFGGAEAYLVTQRTNEKGKIHASVPGFVFEPDNGQTDYIDGWIISQANGKYGLKAPSGEQLLFNQFEEIKYLGEHWFGVSDSPGNWLMIHSRSGSFNDSSFTSLGSYSNGWLQFTQGNTSGLMDARGSVVARCENCKFEISGGQAMVKEANQTTVYAPDGVIVATLAPGETLLGSGFIISKDKRGYYQAKLTEDNRYIPLKSLKMPEAFGECIVIQNGNYYTLMRKDGTVVAKKADLYEKYRNGLIGFRLGKKWAFYNPGGTQVHVSGNVKNRIVQEDLLMLDENGKVYFIDSSGKTYDSDAQFRPVRENAELSKAMPADDYTLIREEGKWGALDREGKLVIPCVHDELSYLGNDEFSVSLAGKRAFANTQLKLILPAQYDEVFIVADEFYLVKNGNRYGYLRKDGTWLREME